MNWLTSSETFQQGFVTEELHSRMISFAGMNGAGSWTIQ